MLDTVKRLNYYDHQFLRAPDFTDEQNYHLGMRRLHNSYLHTWGVVTGLQVSVATGGTGTAVTVNAGIALDSTGREMVLPADTNLELGGEAPNTTLYITIAYDEQQSDPTTETGGAGNTRMTEMPKLSFSATAPADKSMTLILAKVPRTATGLGAVDVSDRKQAGVALGNDLSVNTLTLKKDGVAQANWPVLSCSGANQAALANAGLTMSGNLGIGPAAANRNLTVSGAGAAGTYANVKNANHEVLLGVDSATILSAMTASDLQIRTNNVTRIVVAQGDGNTRIQNTLTVGLYAMPTAEGRLGVTGSVAELSFARRTLTSWPAAPAAGDRFVWYNPDGTARLYTDKNGDLLAVDARGFLGIGTNAPVSQLHIQKDAGGALGPSLTLMNGGGGGNAAVALDFFTYGPQPNPSGSIRAIDENNFSNGIAFFTKDPGAAANKLTERMRLTSAGNVGIGTPSPDRILTISSPGVGTGVYANVKNDKHEVLLGVDSATILSAMTASDLQIRTNNATRIVVQAGTGNVGIATTEPNAPLDIGGNAKSNLQAVLARGADANFRLVVQNGDGNNAVSAETMRLGVQYFGQGWNSGFRFIRGGGALDGSLAIDTFGAERLRITSDGSVGIGLTNPGARLTIRKDSTDPGSLAAGKTLFVSGIFKAGTARDGGIEFRHDNLTQGIGFGYNTIYATGTNPSQDLNLMSLGTGNITLNAYGGTTGNVGIGTTAPTQAKLVISGSGAAVNLQTGYGYLNNRDPTGKSSGMINFSIYADGRIACPEFNAFSDERIKTIQGRSDSAADLRAILAIEITDFRYKDVFRKGQSLHKKVIAQQVEKVFPQAVSRAREVVPDIYKTACFHDGWVELASDLKTGERVKLIDDKTEGVYEVLEAMQDKFRTDFKPQGDKVFVYGREVNDFRTVDYDALSMLNISAAQQIKKELDSEVTALKAESGALLVRLDGIERQGQRITQLENEVAELNKLVSSLTEPQPCSAKTEGTESRQ